MWLTHLKKLRKTGENRWRACCPSHGGNNPTALSIKHCEDNSWVVYCFSCNASGVDVFEALGLDVKELMGDKEFKQKQTTTDIYDQAFIAIAEAQKKKGNYLTLQEKRKVRLINARNLKG